MCFVRKRQAHVVGPGPHWLQHAPYCHLPEADETAVQDVHWEGESSLQAGPDKLRPDSLFD